MDKVYILLGHHDCEDTDVLGVYSDKELAYRSIQHFENSYDSVYVEEHEVIKPS